MFRIDRKGKVVVALVAFLLVTPLTIFYLLDGAGVFDTRSRADDPGTLSEEFAKADLNADNKITIADFEIWLSSYRQFKNNPNSFSQMSDLNNDSSITISDFAIWLNLWRKYKAQNNPTTPTNGGTTPVTFGTGADGSVVFSATDVNLNRNSYIAGRGCADAISYSVVGFDSSTVVAVDQGVSSDCIKAGDEVLLINLQGTQGFQGNVGNYETLIVSAVAGDRITFSTSKQKYYGDGVNNDANIGKGVNNQKVMLQRVPNYVDVSLSSGSTLSPDAYDYTLGKGGVVFFRATGAVDISGVVDVSAKGYAGGVGNGIPGHGVFYTGTDSGKGASSAVGNEGVFSGAGGGGTSGSNGYEGGKGTSTPGSFGGGGGGGTSRTTSYWWAGRGGGGGGGGYGTPGDFGKGSTNGTAGTTSSSGDGGAGKSVGHSDSASSRGGGAGGGSANFGGDSLGKLLFGGGGGAGGRGYYLPHRTAGTVSLNGTDGGNGGGIVYIAASIINVNNKVLSNGGSSLNPKVGPSKQDGDDGKTFPYRGSGGSGGGGAGGSILLIGNNLSLGESKVTATGGVAASPANVFKGGDGGFGRIRIEYVTGFSGVTSPTSSNAKIN